MHEEIEYAEMLEIPVSTVNVVKKNSRRKKSKAAELSVNTNSAPQTENNPALNSTQNLAQSSAPASLALPQNALQNPLKDSVIAQVNSKLNDEANALSQANEGAPYPESQQNPYQNPAFTPAQEITADADLFAESANSDGRLDFDPIPERIDTVRLYSTPQKRSFWDFFRPKDREFSISRNPFANRQENLEQNEWANDEFFGNDSQFYNENDSENTLPHFHNESHTSHHSPRAKAVQMVLNIEFAAACALCATIFLTNIFMPNSAINTFFRSMNGVENTATDTRTYADFTLSPVISELSNAELNLSPTGILSFTEEGCVYPAADGVVADVTQEQDGTYRIKIAHSNSFTGVIGGLDYVYYAVGDAVKCNVPVGYSDGEAEVQVTMYSQGLLLNCFELTEENCLTWIQEN